MTSFMNAPFDPPSMTSMKWSTRDRPPSCTNASLSTRHACTLQSRPPAVKTYLPSCETAMLEISSGCARRPTASRGLPSSGSFTRPMTFSCVEYTRQRLTAPGCAGTTYTLLSGPPKVGLSKVFTHWRDMSVACSFILYSLVGMRRTSLHTAARLSRALGIDASSKSCSEVHKSPVGTAPCVTLCTHRMRRPDSMSLSTRLYSINRLSSPSDISRGASPYGTTPNCRPVMAARCVRWRPMYTHSTGLRGSCARCVKR
mmetsp:Transcript_18876/g.58622  ORF Transcript_18876/g.58622 Transcript_18876/m.58622 type:complete len:257 (+) Transcript_18876:795-1565(+)